MEDTHSTLLLRLKDRTDQTAWRTFDELYQPMLVRYAQARGLDLSDAEDAAQQCVEAVLKQIGQYQHSGSFKTWLRAIVEKKICDRFRVRGREIQADSALLSALPDSGEGPEQAWERQWRSSHFQYCAELARREVAENTYSAFVAYAIQGQTAEEVAAQLGLSLNQVYVAKHRVLDRIRVLISELTAAEPSEVLA
ncbi:MAG: sigma-70 family RNA polymerase sigma factor [Planctomycetes bacterium]|nr:sigma-70 family RNA polymerase sigma factor [Planctomycetota bacterium]MBI3833214.1 sigma-70 family RNA polymerase sigma factor [Planctomycetota bacterium]